MCFDMIYLLTAIGLTSGGSSTVHIYTQTIHRTTQLTTHRTTKFCRVLRINSNYFPMQHSLIGFINKKEGMCLPRGTNETYNSS